MKKIAIITSLIGAYDNGLLEIKDIDKSKYDLICFTNNKKLRSKTWELRIVDPIIPNDNGKSSYYYKWQNHLILDHEKYDYLVWVDSSVWEFNVQKFEEYLNKFISMENCALYIEKHPSRNTLRDELEVNCQLNKDDIFKMRNQVESYFKQGFNDSKDCIMVETGFSFRRFKDPDLIKMCDLLWSEMKNPESTKRDQLIFDYVVWKTGFKNKIELFTFEQKSEILKFKDHPHRPYHKEKILLCGPWQGEIGWELFCWQGYLRWLSQNEPFDKIVIGTEPEHKFLYDDFADQIIMTPVTGTKKGCQLNGRDPFFRIQNSNDKDLRLVKPSMSTCYNILSNIDKQEFIEFNFPEEFKKKYSNLDFEEINLAFKNKNIPNYLRKQLNLPLKNNFKIIVIGGPAEKYIDRCLQSIKDQSNSNWECQVVLTPSNDKTFEIAKRYENEKIKVCLSDKDSFVIKNFQKALDLLNPEDDDIICTVDADDWLANTDVLTTIDKYYMENPELLVTYGSWQVYPSYTNIASNCFKYESKDFQKGIRKTFFRGTHFRTLKYKVFKNINQNEFVDSKTNEVYKAAGDAAIMIPALEMVGEERSKFIPEILYVYNRETEFNEDKEKRQLSIDATLDISNKPVLNVVNFDKYRKISLCDRTFPHGNTVMNYNFKNFDSMIEWDRNNLNRDVIFFTDFTLDEVDKFNNKEKYALLIEPPCIFPQIYEKIKTINHKFTNVFTFNEDLLKLGQNYLLYAAGGTWIEPKYQQMYKKSKEVSIVVSNMNRTEGHKLRHEIVKRFGDKIDVYGKAYNPIDNKIVSLKDYRFQIVVENCSIKNYFSEKLVDCFLTGTIPIYCGCTNLKDFGFDLNGIIQFNKIDQLEDLLKVKNDLHCMFPECILEKNYDIAKKYMVTENYLFDNYFKNRKL